MAASLVSPVLVGRQAESESLADVLKRVVAGEQVTVVVGGEAGEVLSETALPRQLEDSVLARAYGLVFPTSIGGIVAGSLIAGPVVAALGLTGAMAVVGLFVLAVGGLLLYRPLDVTVIGERAEAQSA